MSEREEKIQDIASDPKKLREYAEGKVDFTEGGYGAHAVIGDTLNLTAIAIGLGLENIEYEPENFLGLVYRMDIEGTNTTVILLWDGQATAVDAPDESTARTAVIKVAERLVKINEAGSEDDDDLWSITVPKESEITVEMVS